jgi:hypothetical protein
MKQVISSEAKKILDETKNEYFRDKNAIIIDAVNFGEDAFKLAGPFNDKFGLVYVYDSSENAKSFEQLMLETKNSCYNGTTWMPRSVKIKVETALGNKGEKHLYSNFWFNDKTKEAISDIDINNGASTDGFRSTGDRTTVFFNTENALNKVKSILTKEELEEWNTNITSNVNQWEKEMADTSACKERPFLLRVQGTDDCSYSKTFETLEECTYTIEKLKENGFKVIDKKMRFTN